MRPQHVHQGFIKILSIVPYSLVYVPPAALLPPPPPPPSFPRTPCTIGKEKRHASVLVRNPSFFCFSTFLMAAGRAFRAPTPHPSPSGRSDATQTARRKLRPVLLPAQIAMRSLAVDGRYLVIGFASGAIPSPPLNVVLLKEACVMGVFWGQWVERHPEER